jgi:hypothetical protein
MASNRFTDVIAPRRTSPLPESSRQQVLDTIGHPPPEIADPLEKFAGELSVIDANKDLVPAAQQRMRQERTDEARKKYDALAAKYVADGLREFRQAEGEARKALLGEAPSIPMASTDEERARILVRQNHDANTLRLIELDLREIDAATDVADLVAAFEEAAARGGMFMDRCGRRALSRATALVTAAHRPGTESLDDRRLADMRTRWAEFSKANPRPAERLQRVLNQKAARHSALTSQTTRWRQVYGLE